MLTSAGSRRRPARERGPGRRPAGLAGEVVEVAVPGASQEGGEIGPRADQRGSGGVAGVADRDGAAGQGGDLDAVPAGVAVAALAPGCLVQAGVLGAGGSQVHAGVLSAGSGVSPCSPRLWRAAPRRPSPLPMPPYLPIHNPLPPHRHNSPPSPPPPP